MSQVKVKVYAGLVCPRRSLDARKIERYFRMNGGAVTSNPADATHIIVITCGFIDRNIRESVDIIRVAGSYGAEVIVGGCLEDIAPEELRCNFTGRTFTTKRISDIDALFPEHTIPFSRVPDANGLHDYNEVDCFLGTRKNISEKIFTDRVKGYLWTKHFTIRVGDGCNCKCTYCSHTNAIGKYRSKPFDECVNEFERGYGEGERVFTVTSMDTGYYGADIGSSLPALLNAFLSRHEDVRFILEDINPVWINKYHEEITHIVSRGKIAGIQSPVQSGSAEILTKMHRWHDVEKCKSNLKAIREADPGIVLSTEVLIGFPSESEADFQDTLGFLRDSGFEFTYLYPYYENEFIESRHIFPKCEESIITARLERALVFFEENGISYSIMKKNDANSATEELILPNGYRARVFSSSKSIASEIWEEHEYDSDCEITDGMNVVDIGANQGFFSLYAASKGAQVLSVEPEQANFGILSENIRGNGLDDRICSFNGAVSTREGEIDLLSMDFGVDFASGMVTTTPEFLPVLDPTSQRQFSRKKVRSVKLGTLFDMFELDRVDLLKIDTEGGELDILKSLPADRFGMISRIVMETHDVYRQKDLYLFLRKNGFRVMNFRKFAGHFRTGYLYAENDRGRNTAKPSVVALIGTPRYAICAQDVTISAEESFSSEEDRTLSYEWSVDGRKTGDTGEHVVMSFNEPGCHLIGLRVMDDKGIVGETEDRFWVFDKTFFNEPEGNKRIVPGEWIKLALEKNTASFTVNLPVMYSWKKLVVRVNYLNSKTLSAVITYNGSTIPVERVYQEISLPVFDYDTSPNVRFEVSSSLSEKIKFKVWFLNENDQDESSGTSGI